MVFRDVRLSLLGVAVLAVPLLAVQPVLADFTPSKPTPKPQTKSQKCALKYGKSTRAYRRCIKTSRNVDDETLYATGRDMARLDQDYDGAIETLRLMQNQNDPRALTMIGYSLRKSGRIEEAMGFYGRALVIDANNVQTREYLGEAYLQQGDLAGAKAQLTEISARCGVTWSSLINRSAALRVTSSKRSSAAPWVVRRYQFG
jgi:Flp pilus assembly protein TadD